ncbi:unnamed protein product [Blepharisma stoltei]|uniref:NADH:ubiquinone reductase (H(+)-translocating) n=1 Tax=Blepharisma stoltei TaxID=1481888 RepID=A0AAU9JX35_9CILI|nr:unnamed protein product [Blepharisma stoltei]
MAFSVTPLLIHLKIATSVKIFLSWAILNNFSTAMLIFSLSNLGFPDKNCEFFLIMSVSSIIIKGFLISEYFLIFFSNS